MRCATGCQIRSLCIEHAIQKNSFLWELFGKTTRSIEVVHSGQLQKVIFRVPEDCLKLLHNNALKNDIEQSMYDVPRDNPRQKAVSFVTTAKHLCFKLRRLRAIQENPRTSWVEQYQSLIEDGPFMLSVLICLLIFLFYGDDSAPWGMEGDSEVSLDRLDPQGCSAITIYAITI